MVWSVRILRTCKVTPRNSLGRKKAIRLNRQSVIPLTLDTRDNRQEPTEGYIFRLSNTVAGLGGDIKNVRSTLKGQYFYQFAKQWVGSIKGEYSRVFGIGQDVRVLDRYSLGGDSFRGFNTSGIGPRDRSTNDALGGLTRRWDCRVSIPARPSRRTGN